MKRIFLPLAVAALTIFGVNAQHEAIDAFIHKYKQSEGFISAYLSRDLFEVATRSEIKDQDWKKLHRIVQNIGSLRILAADSIESGLSLYKEAFALIPTPELDELLAVQHGQERVRIWSKDDGQRVTDLILLVGLPHEFVLVCFSGSLELGNLSALADMFEAEAVEHLVANAEAVAVDFKVNPNPGNGLFTLSCPDEQDPPLFLNVTDQQGRMVVEAKRLSSGATQQVDLQYLSSGIYWLQVKTQQGKVGVRQVQIVKN